MHNGKLILSDKPKNILYSDKIKKTIVAPLFVQAADKLKLKTKPINWNSLNKYKIKLKKKKPKKKKVLLSLENISFKCPENGTFIKNLSLDVFENEIFKNI